MAYVFVDDSVGMPAVTSIITADATSNNPVNRPWKIGDIRTAADPVYGVGEFIYLKGVVGTVAGSLVTYNGATGVTALAPVGTNKPQPVAVAMAACVANCYGWYQISGIAVAKKTSSISLASGVAVGVKTIGLIASTGTGKEIQGALTAAVVTAASALTTVALVINRPHMQGRVS